MLKVELIHCKSCKNVRHHKNFFKRSIRFIHEVLISWWTIMQCLCWNDWLTSKSYKRIRMWIRTNSVLIVLSVCWTLLCFYSGTMPFLSISLLIIVRVSIHCFINGSSCNNVAISHFSCGLYVNFTFDSICLFWTKWFNKIARGHLYTYLPHISFIVSRGQSTDVLLFLLASCEFRRKQQLCMY